MRIQLDGLERHAEFVPGKDPYDASVRAVEDDQWL